MKGQIKNYTPPTADPNVGKLEELIDSDYQPVQVAVVDYPGSRESECYVNVERYIKAHGGKMQLGWLILKTDFAYEAMAHAVVEQSEEFIDVTPIPGLRGVRRLFVPDDRMVWQGRSIPSYRICHTGRAIDEDFTRLMKTLDMVRSKIVFAEGSDTRMADHPLILRIEDDLLLRHIPHLVSKMPLVSKAGKCYCNSGKQYLNCHRLEFALMIEQTERAIESLATQGWE